MATQYSNSDLERLKELYAADIEKIHQAFRRINDPRTFVMEWPGLQFGRMLKPSIKTLFSHLGKLANDGHFSPEIVQYELNLLEHRMPGTMKWAMEILENRIVSANRGQMSVDGIPGVFGLRAVKRFLTHATDDLLIIYGDAHVALERLRGSWESEFVPVFRNIQHHREALDCIHVAEVEDAQENARRNLEQRTRQTINDARSRGYGLN